MFKSDSLQNGERIHDGGPLEITKWSCPHCAENDILENKATTLFLLELYLKYMRHEFLGVTGFTSRHLEELVSTEQRYT